MFRILFPLLTFAASAPTVAAEVPFEPRPERFADAAACKAHLGAFVASARARGDAATEGPYEVAPGDIRAHAVILAGSGHRITEQRCVAEVLSGRSWRHSMDEAEAEEAETIESMAAKAEWLKKGRREQ